MKILRCTNHSALRQLGLLLSLAWPLALFGAGVASFTDTDDDTYTVTLTGGGVATVMQDNPGMTGKGPIASIALAGTKAGSALKVTVKKGATGDGKVAIGAITGDGPLGSISAPSSDLIGSGITLAGSAAKVKLANIADGAQLSFGTNPKPKPLALTAANIGAAVLTAPGSTLSLTALSLGAGAKLEFAQAATLKATAGSFLADVSTPGKIVAISVKGGDLTGHIEAAAINGISVKKNKAGVGGSIIDSFITAKNSIGAVIIDGNLTNTFLMAGADFGDDGEPGGTGVNADNFGAGSLRTVMVGGNVTNSIIGAGLTPVDTNFRDLNDGVIGGKLSKLGTFTVKGTLDAASLIGAGVFPAKVSVNKVKFKPLTDLKFISRAVRILPPPKMVAPPIDKTVAAPALVNAEFLFTGKDPIQTGVAPGAIEMRRIAVLRGRVINRDGVPIPGVTVKVLDHAEFGETLTRADGMFDLAVNGGGLLIVKFDATGLLPAQRQVDAAQLDFNVLGDVVMMGVDPMVTDVAFGAATPMQIHEAAMQSDASGDRHAMLMFTPGTSASLVMPDGSTEPMNNLKIRASEFTVGENGKMAMPAALPATSAYTYCVDLTADEAVNAGATSIEFDQPVWFYVENFLGFPAGNDVPSGFYDKEKGQWVPGQSGKVITIVSITSGAADLDVTGDGTADTGTALTALEITDAERQQLGAKYLAGQGLWRIPIPHFSAWDANWGSFPPANAIPPKQKNPKSNEKPDDPECCGGSIVEIQGQVLRETFPVTGPPFSLNYSSDRVPGRKAANQVRIDLADGSEPADLKRIELEIHIAGRTFSSEHDKTARFTTFEWDGLDAYGRLLQGQQPAKIRIGYVYDGTYQQTPRFGYNGNGIPITGDRARNEIILSTNYVVALGALDIRRQSIGGWTFNVHHTYDPIGRVLYQGNGSRRSVESVNSIITTIAGTGVAGFSGDGGPAKDAQLSGCGDVDIGPDGSVFILDEFNHRIRKIDRSGIITTFAGTGEVGDTGDEGPATEASISPIQMRFGPDGSLYVGSRGRIRRIDPAGIIHAFAGDGTIGSGGDGGPALAAQLPTEPLPHPAPDGSVYFVDIFGHRIRRVDQAGVVHRVAGEFLGFSGDGGPAVDARLSYPVDMAFGPDGSLFIGDTGNFRIRKVSPSGLITTYAGGGNPPVGNGDGGLATDARLAFSNGGVDTDGGADGSIYFSERGSGKIRRIGTDGIITSFVGTGTQGDSGDGGPALQAQIRTPFGLRAAPDGSFYVADFSSNRVRRVAAPLPGFTAEDIAIPSEDGTQLYRFDVTGRHLATLHAFTGATLFTFGYDADGQLVKITDASANITRIDRTAAGAPTAIVAPYGQRTVLTIDANGSLATARDPRGGTFTFTSSADGLLATETDPHGHVHIFTYDAAGRLIQDDQPGAAITQFARVDLPNGYMVTETDGGTAAGSFKIETLTTGDELRTNTDALGLATTDLRGANGVNVVTTPDGMVQTTTTTGDPRFGFQAPIESKTTLATPGGKLLTLETARTVALSDPADVLSLTSWTETSKINGRSASTTFTSATKTFDSVTPVGRHVVTTTNNRGDVTSTQFGNLAMATFAYDARGRLTTVTSGQGAAARVESLIYNSAGFVATTTDPLARNSRLAYDASGNPTEIALPGNRSIRLAYDKTSRLVGVTPPLGALHQLDYTEFDALASYTAPDVGGGPAITTFDYNARKLLARFTRPGGQTIDFIYDGADRLTTRTVAAGATIFSYHPTSGLLTTITGPDASSLSFTYDGAVPLGSTWVGSVAGSVTRTIDNDLRTATQSVNGANTVAFTYDNDGLITAAGALSFTRAPATGLVTSAAIGNIAEFYTYDEFGAVTSLNVTASGNPIFAQQFSYDKLGRITTKTEMILGTVENFAYAYDAAGRLIEVKKNSIVVETYAYDDNGNRTTGGATYDAQDRLIQRGSEAYTYTPAGDLLTKTVGGATTTYNYNALGNLMAVTLPDGPTIEYVHDGQNRRVGRKVNGTLAQGFLYQSALKITAETDSANSVVSRFVHVGGRNVPSYMIKGGGAFRLICDSIGSVRLVVDTSTGAVAQRIDYDAFGRVLADTAPGFQPFGFAGGLYDPLTVLTRFGARDYDPHLGRWTAKDPIMFFGGDTNLYAYAINDPVNRIDPSGFKDKTFCESLVDKLKKELEKRLREEEKKRLEELDKKILEELKKRTADKEAIDKAAEAAKKFTRDPDYTMSGNGAKDLNDAQKRLENLFVPFLNEVQNRN